MLTIEKFQYLYAFSQIDMPEIEKLSRMVEIYTDLNAVDIDRMKVKKFNRICTQITQAFDFTEGKPAKYIRANGHNYRINYDIMTAGQYIDGSNYSKNVIENLNKIMATICTRVNFFGKEIKVTHEERVEDLKHADFKAAYHTSVFFYAVFLNTMRTMKPYLIQESQKIMSKDTATALMTNLINTLDGFIQPKWLQRMKLSL